MAEKKFPVGASTDSVKYGVGEWKCPNCGAFESEGGCANPEECTLAMARMEAEYASEITDLLDYANNRTLHLLIAGFEALDLLNIGLVVTGSAGLLLMANRAAEQILERHDGLELTSSGVLCAMKGCGPGLGQIVQPAAKAGQPRKSDGQDTVVAVRRPSGGRALTLLVRPIQRAMPEEDAASPAVLVFILDPEVSVEAAETELRQLYGLTSTEARLANLLMEGRTLKECCDQLAVRRSTGRTHLQHLFEKVGAQRQSELVSLLLKSIGLVRTGNRQKKHQSPSRGTNIRNDYIRMLLSGVSRANTRL
jgi:DNA-binding CsgD family transcriptional regulator